MTTLSATPDATLAAPVAAAKPRARAPRSKKVAPVPVSALVVEQPAAVAAVAEMPEPEEIELPVVAPAAPAAAAPEAAPVEDEKKRKRTAGKDKLLTDFEALTAKLTPLLETQKTLWKEFLKVKSDTYRLLKLKTTERRTKDVSNSGFMKPVRVSRELELFLQKDNAQTDKLTRAYLTATLCEYIKKHNLQNPQDKRIIRPDDSLKRLFQLTDAETEPLTYYNIQKKIQSHIFKLDPPPAEAAIGAT